MNEPAIRKSNKSVATDALKLLAYLKVEASKDRRLFESDPDRCGAQYASSLNRLVEEANRMIRKADRTQREALTQMIREALVEWNRIPLPLSEAETRRWRAIYALKYLNSDNEMLEMLQADRIRQHGNPEDLDAASSLGWTLYTLSRHMIGMGRPLEAAKLLREFDAVLPAQLVPKELNDARAKLGERLDPHSPHSQTGRGWELAKLLKAELQHDKPDTHRVKEVLREYLTLEHVEKPSILHSQVLLHATRAQPLLGQLYPSFVKKWGLEHLREEDCQPYKPKEKKERFSSLAEKMGMALGKSIKGVRLNAIPDGIDLVWIKNVLAGLTGRFPQQPWIAYHYAKTLTVTGECESAREALLPIVRSKQTDFWVWAALADTYATKTPERLACLSRAALCRVIDRNFLNGVLVRLRDELRFVDETSTVREIEKIVPTRRTPIVSDEFDAGVKSASKSGPTVDDDATAFGIERPGNSNPANWSAISAVLGKYAPHADDLVFEGLPWVDAIVAGHIGSKRDIRGAIFVLYRSASAFIEICCRSGRFSVLDKAKLGEPIHIQVSSVGGRNQLIAARVRVGVLWDVLPERVAVVKNVNSEKGVLAIALSADEIALAHFDRFPEAKCLKPGNAVFVRFLTGKTGLPGRLVSIDQTSATPDSSFFRAFSGALRINAKQGFGFVGQVYVPKILISKDNADGMNAEGFAILETNPKTGQKGWRALFLRGNPGQ